MLKYGFTQHHASAHNMSCAVRWSHLAVMAGVLLTTGVGCGRDPQLPANGARHMTKVSCPNKSISVALDGSAFQICLPDDPDDKRLVTNLYGHLVATASSSPHAPTNASVALWKSLLVDSTISALEVPDISVTQIIYREPSTGLSGSLPTSPTDYEGNLFARIGAALRAHSLPPNHSMSKLDDALNHAYMSNTLEIRGLQISGNAEALLGWWHKHADGVRGISAVSAPSDPGWRIPDPDSPLNYVRTIDTREEK